MTPIIDWQDILSPLLPRNTPSRLSDKDMVDIISAAAVAAEHQLKNGGLVDLLNRARDAALAGSFETARIAALGILEFHQAVQQRRGQPSLISNDPKGAIYALFAVTLYHNITPLKTAPTHHAWYSKQAGVKSSDSDLDRIIDKRAVNAPGASVDDGVEGDMTPLQPAAASTPRRLNNLESSVIHEVGEKRKYEDSECGENSERQKNSERQPLPSPPNYTVTWTGSVRLLQEGHKPGAELCSIGMQV